MHKKKKENIDLNKIIFNQLNNNKILALSIGILFTGYLFQDIMFSRKFSKIVSDVPNFVKDLDFSKILGIFFPYLIAYFLFYVDDLIGAETFPKMETNVIHELVNKVLESIKTSKKQINVSELVLNLKSILDVKNIYILSVVYILPTIMIGLGLLYYFFINDIKSGLMVVGVMALFLMINIYLEEDCIKVSRDHEKSIDNLYDNIQDVMVNYETIITSNTIDKELNNIQKSEKLCSNKHKKSEIFNSEITLGLSVSSMLFMLLIDGIAVNLYFKELMSPDMLITVCMMCYTFTQYYNSSIFKLKNVMHHIGRYKELVNYFGQFPIEEENNKKMDNAEKGFIIFKNVRPIHDNVPATKKLNLKIKNGSKIAIVGEIGAGKTSVLKVIAGLKKYKGNIYIDGKNLDSFTNEELTNDIIYIQQHPKLFNRTIWENLSYGGNYSKETVIKYINNLGLDKFFKKFPNGVFTNVGKEGSKLSGGQKQIVSLIRAIIYDKKILLLDEPTSSLDSETKKIFMDLINKMAGKTIIVVTHDKTIYDLFDEIVEV
jgi:ABC-type multidrug transport system fused ATPase/permease subunit